MRGMLDTDGEENARVYAVRTSERAASQIEAEQDRLQELAGDAVAESWAEGMADAIASLATLPERCSIAVENDLFPHGTLRQLIYRRRRSGPAWRLLFSVHEADENDPPTVRVHRIQHGAQEPLTEWPTEDEE